MFNLAYGEFNSYLCNLKVTRSINLVKFIFLRLGFSTKRRLLINVSKSITNRAVARMNLKDNGA